RPREDTMPIIGKTDPARTDPLVDLTGSGKRGQAPRGVRKPEGVLIRAAASPRLRLTTRPGPSAARSIVCRQCPDRIWKRGAIPILSGRFEGWDNKGRKSCRPQATDDRRCQGYWLQAAGCFTGFDGTRAPRLSRAAPAEILMQFSTLVRT